MAKKEKSNELDLTVLNEALKKLNLPEIRLVDPSSLKEQKKNARYFEPRAYKQLVENIKRTGQLESVPLVYEEKGSLHIISGHHRTRASKEAELKQIMVMVIHPKNKDEIVSKQLSHNALTGLDDGAILADLFNSIMDIDMKLASGLDSSVDRVKIESLNFKVGEFKEFSILFMPEDEIYFDSTMKAIIEEAKVKPGAGIRLAPAKVFKDFAKAIMTVKRTENIKSNGIALSRMLDLANEKLEEIQDERREKENDKKK